MADPRVAPTMLERVRRSLVLRPLAGQGGVPRPVAPALGQPLCYPSQSYTAVLDEVQRALAQREGLVVVTGAPGTGKTLLCRTVLQNLEPGVCASVVLDPRVTVDDLLLHVLTDFGVIGAPRPLALGGAPTRHQLMRALQQFLASLIPMWGYAVLVVDEAQALAPDVLEQLRLLLNFETDEARLLQVVLIGQPELNDRLREPGLRQLDDRVARRCELSPLAAAEVGPYLAHRVSMARHAQCFADVIVLDAEDAVPEPATTALAVTPAAVRTFAARSRGVPRALNVLCDRALEISAAHGSRAIDWRVARAAVRRVYAASPVRSRMRLAASAAFAAAIVAMLAALGLGVRSWGSVAAPPAPAPPPPFATLETQPAPLRSIGVKALPVVDSFNVRVGTFRSAASATALAGQLQSAGFPAFLHTGGGAHQVIVGPYLSHAEVVGVQTRLAGLGQPASSVFVESFEPTGPRGTRDRGGLLAESRSARP